jgi:hypothetical protein
MRRIPLLNEPFVEEGMQKTGKYWKSGFHF